jgi:hypothetical protein
MTSGQIVRAPVRYAGRSAAGFCAGAIFCYHENMTAAKEKFLIVDVAPNGASALFLDFDERRELVFERTVLHADFKKFLSSQAGSIFQKSWEGKSFFDSRRRLVVLADARLATTIPVPLEFKRAAADEPVTLSEAEDWLARATAKIFARCRAEATRRLGTGDVDTVLVGQRIGRTIVGGRVVADPVGHSGKKVSFVIELTFANRELAEALKPFFNAPGEFFFAEGPQARLAALARVKPLPVSIIEANDSGKSSLFVLQEAEKECHVAYREPFPWDGAAMVESIAHEFGVGFAAAAEIYEQYAAHEVSDSAKKYFAALVAPAKERLLQAVDKAQLHGAVYLDAPRDLPLELPYRRRRAVIEDVPVDALLKKFGFSSVGAEKITSRMMLRYLAPFFELYFDNSRSEINELLRKKLHWLA